MSKTNTIFSHFEGTRGEKNFTPLPCMNSSASAVWNSSEDRLACSCTMVLGEKLVTLPALKYDNDYC